VHADDGGPRAVAAPPGALVGSRRLWYSMLNVPVRCEVVLKFRAATSTLPKHEDTRGSNISKTEHSTVSPLSLSHLFYSSTLRSFTLPAQKAPGRAAVLAHLCLEVGDGRARRPLKA
jgi:hypothetical protein